MASTKVCPNCGAKNPSANRFCEDCGYDLNKAIPSTAPKVALFCPNGHTVSDTSLGFCDVCGEKLTSEKPEPPTMKTTPPIPPVDRVEPLVPPITVPAGKKCPSCGAINPEDSLFCEECGAALAADYTDPPIVKPIKPVNPEHELPDIPDIMHTLTNDDMKR